MRGSPHGKPGEGLLGGLLLGRVATGSDDLPRMLGDGVVVGRDHRTRQGGDVLGEPEGVVGVVAKVADPLTLVAGTG